MKKANITIDHVTRTLSVSKAYNKKASVFGSLEYHELRRAIDENPGYHIVIKTVKKKSYHGLSFSRMEEYIKTKPDSKNRLIEFETVKKIAEAKGGMYPLTKQWFFKTYPEYMGGSVSKEEIAAMIADINAENETDAMIAEATAEAERKVELIEQVS